MAVNSLDLLPCFAIALHFVYYNFVKQHKTLRATPAMAAGFN